MGLKSLRLEKGWSQEQLAQISGLSERTIQRAERGETPSLETLRSLAASFDRSPAELRDLIAPQEESPEMTASKPARHAATPDAGPLLPRPWMRFLIAVAVYIAVMTWLAVMQALAGWDPELLPWLGLTGAGLLASLAYLTWGESGDEDSKTGTEREP